MVLSLFRAGLERHRMLEPGDRVLLAVSGGADSLCLLHLFLAVRREYRLGLAVAHFNHRLRGRDSDGDEAFVRELAARHSLPFVGGRSMEVSAAAGRSLQETLRLERLAFLLGAARRRRCRRVALGHHGDDQAETFVLRLLTEGGPAGLGGIPPASHGGRIIHPLLAVRRRQIEAYLLERGLTWRRDRSNESGKYLRNRLRLRLLPQLAEQYNPRIVERLGEIASLLRDDNGLLEELAGPVAAKARHEAGRVLFPSRLLDATPTPLLARALLSVLRAMAPPGSDLGRRHLEALLERRPAGPFRVWNLPGGLIAALGGRGLTIYGPGRFPATPPPFDLPLAAPGRVVIAAAAARVFASLRARPPRFDPGALPGLPWRASLDRETVRFPLRVRSRRPGDRFHPLGMKAGKKLKEVLIDGKVPLPLRDRLPLVCDEEGIVWVPGLRPCRRCRVTSSTRKLLMLRAEVDASDLP